MGRKKKSHIASELAEAQALEMPEAQDDPEVKAKIEPAPDLGGVMEGLAEEVKEVKAPVVGVKPRGKAKPPTRYSKFGG